MSEHLSTYSTIISPRDYNRLMSEQHLYIAVADQYIINTIGKEVEKGARNIVELGCGPADVVPLDF